MFHQNLIIISLAVIEFLNFTNGLITNQTATKLVNKTATISVPKIVANKTVSKLREQEDDEDYEDNEGNYFNCTNYINFKFFKILKLKIKNLFI